MLAILAATPTASGADAAKALEILRSNCGQCHSKAMAMSGLDLSTREGAMKGGSRGAAVVSGEAAKSKLIEAVERKGKLAMPPTKALAEAEVAILRRWIDEGAEWPQEPAAQAVPQTTGWAFQRIVKPSVPKSGQAWVRNEIDEFIIDRLKEESLHPSPAAAKAALARRAYFDLWGLSPTIEQVREFTSDTSVDAWPKLIDKLLASTHYGEKWGRHW